MAAARAAATKMGRASVSRLLAVAALSAALLNPGVARAVLTSDLPDLSLLTPYATFGNFFNDHNVMVNGNAGVSNDGLLKLESPSTITGNLHLGIGATASGGGYPGQVQGTITTGIDFTAAQNQVFSASSALAAFAADQILASLNTGLSISGNGAVKVVNITGNVDLGSGENISFTGGAGEYLVLNIFGDLDMGGDAMIGTLGQASHILVNLVNTGSLGNVTHVDNLINATTLIPYATYAEFHSVNGAIYGGFGGDGAYGLPGTDGNKGAIKLMSGATVKSVPFSPPSSPSPPPSVPDAGSSLMLMSLGLGSLVLAKRRFLA